TFSDVASAVFKSCRPRRTNALGDWGSDVCSSVTLKNELYQYYSGLTVNFADGVSWSQTQIEQMLLDQASAANGGSVYGYNGKDEIGRASCRERTDSRGGGGPGGDEGRGAKEGGDQ